MRCADSVAATPSQWNAPKDVRLTAGVDRKGVRAKRNRSKPAIGDLAHASLRAHHEDAGRHRTSMPSMAGRAPRRLQCANYRPTRHAPPAPASHPRRGVNARTEIMCIPAERQASARAAWRKTERTQPAMRTRTSAWTRRIRRCPHGGMRKKNAAGPKQTIVGRRMAKRRFADAPPACGLGSRTAGARPRPYRDSPVRGSPLTLSGPQGQPGQG